MQSTDVSQIDLAQYISVNGRDFKAPFRLFKKSELQYDCSNPRLLWHLMQQRDGKPFNQQEVFDFLWFDQGEELMELMKAIEINNGISNPIFVRQTTDGLWVVVEGNGRVASVEKLITIKPALWANYKIPAYCLPDGMTNLEFEIWLNREHVAGKRPWSAWVRAQRILRLRDQGLTIADIASHLQRNEKDVIVTLLTMPLMEEISKLDLTEDAERLYSQCYEYTRALTNDGKNTEAAKSVLRDSSQRKMVAEVIAGDYFGSNKEVRLLAKMVKNPRSMQKLMTANGNGLDHKTVEKAKSIAKADDNRSNFMREVPKFFNKLLENRQIAVENLTDTDSAYRESWRALRVLINEISTGAGLPPARNRKGL